MLVVIMKNTLLFCLIIYTTISLSQNVSDSSFRLSKSIKADSLKILELINYSTKNIANNPVFAAHSLSLADSVLTSSDQTSKSATYFAIAKIFENLTNHARAIEIYRKSAENAISLNNYEEYLNSTNRIAYLYSIQGNHENAVNIILNNIRMLDEKMMGKKSHEQTYIYAGFIYRNYGQTTKAFSFFETSLKYGDSIDVNGYFHIALHELGNLSTTSGDYSSALKFQLRALKIKESLKTQSNIGYSYHDIGLTHFYRGKPKDAITSLKKAIYLHKKNNDQWGLAYSYIVIADVYSEKDKSYAAKYLDSAYVIANKLNMKSVFSEVYSRYYTYYYEEKRYKEACNYLKLFHTYKDSIKNESIENQIKLVEVKFDSEKKDKEIVKNQLRIKHQKLTIYSITIAFLFTAIFGFWLFILYRRIKETNKQLEQVNATKDKLFSIIAHDLRSPFNAIIGFTELLKSNIHSSSKEELEEMVNHIHSAGNNTFKILDNLLNWARTQTQQINVNISDNNVNELVQNSIDSLRDLALNKNIELLYNQTEETHINTDKDLVSTVLRNLILNAIKYSTKGGTILLSTYKLNNQIEFCVKDSGIGISKELVKTLFTSNFSTSNNGTANEKGTGLGLIICKEFITKLNGNIWVESEIGRGSTFKFSLPLDTI